MIVLFTCLPRPTYTDRLAMRANDLKAESGIAIGKLA
jgi:hypothetical protein